MKACTEYKSELRKARFNYNCDQTKKLNTLRYKNAKDYWKRFKGVFCNKHPDIKMSDFDNYFKAVNNPDDPFLPPMKIQLFYLNIMCMVKCRLCLMN